MLTGNIAATSAIVVDAQDNPIANVTAGEGVYIQVDFATQDLPNDASYRIGFTVNGLTLDSHDLNWGAGNSGTANWYAYWGSFMATPGANQVTVTVDPDQSVPETSYSDNTVSFAFNAAAPAAGTSMSYTVAQIRAAYDLNSIPNFGAAPADGSGQTIALVEAGNEPTILTDLDGFDQAMSLTTSSTQTLYQQYGPASSIVSVYDQDGANITADISNSGSNGVPAEDPTGHWEGEETMDVEWAHAIAPGAKIDIIEVNDDANWPQNLLVGDGIAADLPGVSAVSNSWGLTEESGDTTYDSSTFVTSSGHTGVTFLTASNDNGANVYGGHGPTVGGDGYYPATSPNVVSVGGTELTMNNNAYGSETGWSYPVPANTIENGGSGYQQSGTWSSQSGGFSGTYSTAAGGSSSSASWTIPITQANTGWGTEVSATWIASPSNATDATYTIYDGTQATGTILATVSVDQTKAPAGTVDGSSQFQELGVFFPTLTNGRGTLTVVLDASSANGTVVADAIGAAQAWASTGGPSLIESEPSYQAGFQNTGYRTTPDVSFDASFNGGATCYQNGSLTYSNGGTSLGSPCWAGLIAIVNQGRVALGGTTLNSPGHPQQALQAIYSLPASDFHDITSGYNGFSAAPGYDFVTGRGTPIADQLVPDLVNTVPVVVTEAAGAVSATGATLHGTVNPQGLTATAYFQYSTSSTFTPTFETTIGSGFSPPEDVAVDASGDVFVADMGNGEVKEVQAGAGTITTIGSGFSTPFGVAVDAAGDVFVADTGNDEIEEIPAAGGPIQTIGSGFNGPAGVAVDAEGDVFVADTQNGAVKEVTNSTIRTLASGLAQPQAVAVDASGDVFVADEFNNAVEEIPAGGGPIQTIGSGFNQPTGVALDAAGDVFVADTGNGQVKEVQAGTGTITTIASGFSGPRGLAVDAASDVFVADQGHGKVVELSPQTIAAKPSSVNGSSATAISAAILGLAPGTTYYYRVVATSAAGTVADITSPPQSFTTPTITWADPADITYGTALGATQLDATASISGSFTYTLADGTTSASGVVLHAGQNQVLIATFTPTDTAQYATDTAQVEINVDPAPLTITADDKSMVYGAAVPTLTASYSGFVNGDGAASLTTQPTLTTTATAGSPVSGNPYTITASGAVDPNYTISYVAGSLTVTAAPTSITVSASANSIVYGQAVNLTADVSASPSSPSEGNVAFFDSGNLLATQPVTSGVATLDNVYLPAGMDLITASYSDASGNFASSSTAVEPTSIITSVAGNGTYGFSGDGGQATAAEFEIPSGVAVDSSGDLFIADQGSNRIREVNHTTGIITTVAGNGSFDFSGDGGQATAAGLQHPFGVVLDSSGDLFFVDESDRIREVDLTTGIITTVAGDGTDGFSGDGGQATAAELHSPAGIAVDSSGHLFIADAVNNRIREVDLGTGIITTVAGNGIYRLVGNGGDGGQATAAGFSGPSGVAVDSSGHLFIADQGSNRIRVVNLVTGIITTAAGNGFNGFGGDGGPATAAVLDDPAGIAVDSLGDLFILDGSDRIREVNHATGVITTVAGNGSFGFSGDGWPGDRCGTRRAEQRRGRFVGRPVHFRLRQRSRPRSEKRRHDHQGDARAADDHRRR